MKVERKGDKVVVSKDGETLSADCSGLTNNGVKQLGRQLQVDFVEGKRDQKAKPQVKEEVVVETAPEEVKEAPKKAKKPRKKKGE